MQKSRYHCYKHLKKLRSIIVLLIVILCCSASTDFYGADAMNSITAADISKEDVIKLIKEKGSKTDYYLEELTFQLVNLDEDKALELIAYTDGGVHLGDFFLFDMNMYGKYDLVTEKPWKIESLHLAENPNWIGGIKLHELTERTGGSGIDIYTAHLWYLKDGQFHEAWQGIIKERSTFQDTWYLRVGSYQLIDDFFKLYTWSSDYSIQIPTKTPLKKPTTTVSIYYFDGRKFVLEAKETLKHSHTYPDIELNKH